MSVNSGDPNLDAAVASWLKHDKNPDTRKEVLDDIKNQKWDKLKKIMLGRLKFGTAGLRSRMGAGYMCMNDVVVLQTAQGFCSYLKKVAGQSQLKNGIAVGFDGRYNSKRFAELTAKVFASNNIPVHFFSKVVPTPFVSFATIYYKCAGGIMVTASHNPKWDNGYKVYWGNGSQLLVPHDDNVLKEITECLDIPEEHWCIDNILSNELVNDCLQEMSTQYSEYIKDTLGCDVMKQNKEAAINVVYSAMHGVGYQSIVDSFKAADLQPVISVKAQQDPDPEFPTADFPNPEEVKCLSLGQQLVEECRGQGRDVRLLLVNDPDADRLAVAEFDPCTSSWRVFSGNEVGALLGWWLLELHERRRGPDPAATMLASVVSSTMLGRVLRGRGRLVRTLTGFKWMGNATLLLQQEGKTVLFSFEEAIGYMVNPRIPDKDGVSAAVHMASLASMLHLSGRSLLQQLNALYRQFGFHVTHNSYYVCNDNALTARIFERIRNFHGPGEYPKKVAGLEIATVHDLPAGVQIPPEGKDRQLRALGTGLDLDYTSGEMMMFTCANGLSVMLRTSGTEPKLKYYTEMVYDIKTDEEQVEMKAKMVKMVTSFVEELFEPKKNGLKAQGE